eukprot:gene7212-30998_t
MFNKKNRLKKEEERTKANALIVQRAKEAADLNAQITTLLAQATSSSSFCNLTSAAGSPPPSQRDAHGTEAQQLEVEVAALQAKIERTKKKNEEKQITAAFEKETLEKLAASQASVSARIAELQQLIAARKQALSQPITVGTLPSPPPKVLAAAAAAAAAANTEAAEEEALRQLHFDDDDGSGKAARPAASASASGAAGAAEPEGGDAAANNVRRALKRLAFAKKMLDAEAVHSTVPGAGVIMDMCDALDEDHFNETLHQQASQSPTPPTESAGAAADAAAAVLPAPLYTAGGGVEEIDLGLDSDAESDSTWNSGTLPDVDVGNTSTNANANANANANTDRKNVSSYSHSPRALLVAINYNSTEMQLEGCAEDQQAVQAMLLQQGFAQSDIALLNETTGISPTRGNIEAGIRWLVREAQPGDVHFLHVAARGWQMQSRAATSADDGMDKFIVPLDYQTEPVLSEGECKAIIDAGLPAGADFVAVIDVANSAAGLGLAFHWDPAHAGWKLGGGAGAADSLAARHGTVLCFSCYHNGPASAPEDGSSSSSSMTATTVSQSVTTIIAASSGAKSSSSGADDDNEQQEEEEEMSASGVHVEGAPGRGKLTACFERAIASGNATIQDVFAAVTGLMLETATTIPTLSSNVQVDGHRLVLPRRPSRESTATGASYFE